MKKRRMKHIVTGVLVPFVAINVFTGCRAKNLENTIENKEYDASYLIETIHTSSKEEILPVTEYEVEDNYPSLNDEEKNIKMIHDSILESNDAIVIKQYNRLVSNIGIENVITNLENLYLVMQIPTDFPDEVWQNLFGDLLKTLKYGENVCDAYGELAFFVHTVFCNDTHYINEFGNNECKAHKLVLE